MNKNSNGSKRQKGQTGGSVKNGIQRTEQPELFSNEAYGTNGDQQETSYPDEFRGSLQSSSRATRILARQAAEEAMDFSSTGKQPANGKPSRKRATSTTAVKKTSRPKKKQTASARKHRREMRKFIVISSALLLIAVALILMTILRDSRQFDVPVQTAEGPVPYIDPDTPFSGELRLFIRPGMKAVEVCRLLDSAGVVSSASRLQRYLIANELDTKIRSGPIFLPREMQVEDAAAALARGYWQHPILMIYDGYTVSQIDRYLYGLSLAAEGEFTAAAQQLAETEGLEFAEGYFYPDEYILQSIDEAAAVLAAQMFGRFQIITSDLTEQLQLVGRTLEEVVIVASMIQRETANPGEMPMIAGIIWKRLDEGIPLGIDATTRYEIDDWSNPLTKEVLNTITPYNTRRKRGLPPTAIANPGFDALQAAAFPRQSPYYFYLHDGSAQIHYAVTYDEHLENVEKYLQ